jgi:hypothetical protein
VEVPHRAISGASGGRVCHDDDGGGFGPMSFQHDSHFPVSKRYRRLLNEPYGTDNEIL